MTNIKQLIKMAVAVLLLAGVFGLTGCSGVSEEQFAELNALRSEVTALTKESNSLKSEKTKLEREIAEQNAKLDECKAKKAAAAANLEKMSK
ncbi:MAG: hypothetical protein KJ799_05255 [Bacteroidetes bacterium]|nr:hypothetical protein [Bacteroidota bacterium]MBU1680967.1 hypothetical protein [Bacteroidota bacterium]MBU2506115.1 hypothetical protein [Bacteroidota bacterium]